MAVLRRFAPVLFLVTLIAVAVGVMIAIVAQVRSPPSEEVIATRVLAVAFMVCDVAITSSLITLLILRRRRLPEAVERRFPFGGRWLWSFLFGLTVLCYLALTPTFLFFLLQMRR
jgi:hypothetical protein